MEADREAEARQLSEKLTRAREQREAAKQLGRGYSALGNPPASASEHGVSEAPTPSAINPPGTSLTTFPQEARPQETRVQETRATLLLVMKPGSRGIRRYEQTADPIVCLGASCYVGGGADVPAASMTRAKALGPGNTLGQRAGACRHSLTCIFRGVETGRGGFDVQAIDLRILRHDRRETVHAEMDRSCSVASGKLACGRPIDAGSYRIWVVPEDVAREAGVNALWAALADGLPSQVANRASR